MRLTQENVHTRRQFVNYVFDKVYESRIYKDISKLIKPK